MKTRRDSGAFFAGNAAFGVPRPCRGNLWSPTPSVPSLEWVKCHACVTLETG